MTFEIFIQINLQKSCNKLRINKKDFTLFCYFEAGESKKSDCKPFHSIQSQNKRPTIECYYKMTQ